MYKERYKPNAHEMKSITETQCLDSFLGLINEQSGGIEIYLHESIQTSFACFLVWEHPTMGKEIDSIEHKDYTGWCCRGWDVDLDTMRENYEINNVDESKQFDIVVDGKVLAKTLSKENVEKYIPLLTEWYRDYGNKTTKTP